MRTSNELRRRVDRIALIPAADDRGAKSMASEAAGPTAKAIDPTAITDRYAGGRSNSRTVRNCIAEAGS
jgi:hypothetical protein